MIAKSWSILMKLLKEFFLNMKIIKYILSTLIIIEILLRLFIPSLNYFYKAATYFRDVMEDNGSYWINKPNYHNKDVQINEKGYRYGELDLKNKKRLLILGDSVVFGWGVAQKDIFSTILDNKTNFEIINMGVPGTNSVEQARMLEHDGLLLEPSVVLWVITSNDLASRSKRPTKLQKNLYRSRLLTALFYIKKRLYTTNYSTQQHEQGLNAIKKVKALCESNDILLIACIYDKNKFYQDHFKRLNINHFVLPKKLSRHRNSIIDGHLNEKGHENLANILQKNIFIIDY